MNQSVIYELFFILVIKVSFLHCKTAQSSKHKHRKTKPKNTKSALKRVLYINILYRNSKS